ncbi:MAG: hypothetical protein V9G63_00245 [Candidatus Competibacter sp.]
MSNSVQSVGGGVFVVDGQSMDYATLVLSLQVERVNLLDKQLVAQAQGIQERNALIAQANDMLARVQQLKNQAAQNNNVTNGGAEMKKFFDANGIKYDTTGNDFLHNKDEWEVAIQGLKNFTDKLNSQSELDFIRVQNLNNKREQALELTTNQLQKDSKIKNDIIGNTR